MKSNVSKVYFPFTYLFDYLFIKLVLRNSSLTNSTLDTIYASHRMLLTPCPFLCTPTQIRGAFNTITQISGHWVHFMYHFVLKKLLTHIVLSLLSSMPYVFWIILHFTVLSFSIKTAKWHTSFKWQICSKTGRKWGRMVLFELWIQFTCSHETLLKIEVE